jgi:CheY-like chemotaxis protein
MIPDMVSSVEKPDFLRFDDFHGLMRHRIMDILLVASPYDTFVLEEAGQLSERVLGEFRNLDLHYGPGLTRTSTGGSALKLLGEPGRFQLVVTSTQLRDMGAAELAAKAREMAPDVPVAVLAFGNRELTDFLARHDTSAVDRAWLWQGDARVLLAMVKDVEDRRNVAHDTRAAGVQVIVVVEDSVRYYSSFLPVIYAELLHQSQRLLAEGVNQSQKILRMRARPKILLCRTFEEAWTAFTLFRDDVLGFISDVEFPREGRLDRGAGLELARRVRAQAPDVPLLLQSSRPEHEEEARDAGADFLLKGSPLLLNHLRRFMADYLGFGDFVFRLPGGREVGRARDLRGLEEQLRAVPSESIGYHAARNHFSKWLKARTEFALAQELRPRRVSDFRDAEDLRQGLLRAVGGYRRERTHGLVVDFDRETFDGTADFYRLGGGSLGGKARGLAFTRQLLSLARLDHGVDGVDVGVPQALVVGTDVFDAFLDENGLRDFAIETGDDSLLLERFRAARFPEDARRDLEAFLERASHPLAVRSSSLLEDSQYQPFTGVYDTFMLPNNHPSREVRLRQLLQAIQRVYASTFTRRAKEYIQATPYRLEEEKMAVLLQRVVGAAHGGRYYPDFAGVARSHNFYPTPPLAAGDGISAVALGLGRTVVDGGNCMRFCPRYPQHLVQFSSVADVLENSQRSFWALSLEAAEGEEATAQEVSLGLEAAEADGTLSAVASTWSAENDAAYDGLSRPGVRLVSFAPVLKQRTFPLPGILERLLEVGAWGMGAPVEVEFAVTLSVPPGQPREFGVLQLRPLALSREREELEIGGVEPSRLVCQSSQVLGNGVVDGVRDVVVVDRLRFDRARSRETAQELAELNADLVRAGVPYLLFGVGRWGSRDPWLGIPVAWEQVSGARVIVEAGFKDFKVAPSQGTHFFQSLTSFHIGYFTVNPDMGEGFVDWEWLAAQPALRETEASSVRHLRFDRPVVVRVDGRTGRGVILKPGA